MRQQLLNFTRPLRRQAREDVLQISIRIMPIQSRRLDEAHDGCRPFSTSQRACKEPVLAPKSPWPDLVLTPIVVYGHSPVIKITRQRRPAFEAVIERLADGRAVGHKVALGDHPGV